MTILVIICYLLAAKNYFIRCNYRNVELFNLTFDRSFSTANLNYKDDFAIERTKGHDKTAQNCFANSDDFIQGDELPNYIEIENENEDKEEDDDYA
ncbi:hypothetical protein P5V15_009966 [Pogonomyrmex californicus]